MTMISYSTIVNGIEVDASYSEADVKDCFLPLLRNITEMHRGKKQRVLIILAAPPGAGKTSLAGFLEKLSRSDPDLIPVRAIGMDGFHRRQEYLLSHTTVVDGKEVRMVDVKGAPETFDVDALERKIRELLTGRECSWPVYDRMLHNPVEDAVLVTENAVLLEGNYLLLDEKKWKRLSDYADYTLFLSAEEELLRKRLIDRRMKTGVEREKAEAFVDFSDMRNVRTVLRHSKKADRYLNLTVVDG